MMRGTSVLTASSYASMFFLGVGTAIIGAASGNIGLSAHQTGLLVSAQNVGFILAVLIAGALADSTPKPRLLAAGSVILSISFFLFYLWRPYGLNLLIMLFLGAGIGTYEGVADAMLLDLHDRRQALFISINHFFVTFGCLAITLYLLFLQMDWRRSLIQSAAGVLALAVIYAFSGAGNGRPGSATLRDRLSFLKTQPVLALFLALATIGAGIELGLTGLLTGFLMSLRGYDLVASKLGLILLLGGVAAGRVILGLISARGRILGLIAILYAAAAVFSAILFFAGLPVLLTGIVLFILGMTVSSLFPLLITLTGIIYRELSGTALGIVKLGVPLGGVLIPFVLSVIARYSSFRLSLVIFPALSLAGCLILAAGRKLIGSRLQGASRGLHS
jgi:MFS family permease